jgi:predicted phage terminase large subunit-like protein
MQPLADGQGLATEEDINKLWVKRATLDSQILKPGRQFITVDLGGLSENARKNIGDSDYTVINHHVFHGGRLYINRIVRGRFTPTEIIDRIYLLLKQYPRTISVKVEEEAHARVLLPYLRADMVKRNVYIPILGIKRDNQTSKENRIKGLQPWFEARMIRFADDMDKVTRIALVDEVQYFPKYAHDDILDTCADAMQNAEGISWEMVPEPIDSAEPTNVLHQMHEEAIFGTAEEVMATYYDAVTGF